MKPRHIITLSIAAALCVSCQRPAMRMVSAETQVVPVDSNLDAIADSAYIAELEPVKEALEKELNIPIGYAPRSMHAQKPESDMLNWACDALQAMAEQVYDGRVDLAVVNAGGLRCDWPAGDITFRSVFELMPFDNELVILTMTGQDLLDLAENCVEQGGQGVSHTFRVKGVDGHAAEVLLRGKAIEPEATYYVATSDYLSGGADGLTALTHYSSRYTTGLKIRDLYIEYIKQTHEVAASLDGRMQLID